MSCDAFLLSAFAAHVSHSLKICPNHAFSSLALTVIGTLGPLVAGYICRSALKANKRSHFTNIEGSAIQLKEPQRIQITMGDPNGLWLWSFARSGRRDCAREVAAIQSRLHAPMVPSKYRPFRIDGKDYLMSLAPLNAPEKLLPLFRESVSTCALTPLVKLNFIQEAMYVEDYMPVTVIDYVEDRQNSHSIERTVRKFSTRDDVFSTHFLRGVVLNRSEDTSTGLSILAEDKDYLKSVGCLICYANSISGCVEGKIPEGPYFMKKGIIYQIWRLYPDSNEAFHLPLVRSSLSSDT